MFNVKFEEKRDILTNLNLINIQTCHSWLLTIHEEDDLCVLLRDKRGRYKRNIFYEIYPDIKNATKIYSIENASKKNCSFSVGHLANLSLKSLYSYILIYSIY
jgi:hypothetical protein